jgi:hypothetical protein
MGKSQKIDMPKKKKKSLSQSNVLDQLKDSNNNGAKDPFPAAVRNGTTGCVTCVDHHSCAHLFDFVCFTPHNDSRAQESITIPPVGTPVRVEFNDVWCDAIIERHTVSGVVCQFLDSNSSTLVIDSEISTRLKHARYVPGCFPIKRTPCVSSSNPTTSLVVYDYHNNRMATKTSAAVKAAQTAAFVALEKKAQFMSGAGSGGGGGALKRRDRSTTIQDVECLSPPRPPSSSFFTSSSSSSSSSSCGGASDGNSSSSGGGGTCGGFSAAMAEAAQLRKALSSTAKALETAKGLVCKGKAAAAEWRGKAAAVATELRASHASVVAELKTKQGSAVAELKEQLKQAR